MCCVLHKNCRKCLEKVQRMIDNKGSGGTLSEATFEKNK